MVIFTQGTHGEDYMHIEEDRICLFLFELRAMKAGRLVKGLQEDNDNIFEKENFGSVKLGIFLEKREYG